MKNYLISALALLSLVVLWKKYSSRTHSAQLSPRNSYLSCQGKTFDVSAAFESEIYLLKSSLPEDEEALKNLLHSSIIYQNQYTFLNSVKINNGSDLKFLTPGRAPEIVITKQEDAPYPFQAEHETDLPIYNFSPEQNTYIKSILAPGKTSKGEPALKVSYTYKNRLIGCITRSKDPSTLSTLNFFMPLDPYLAYFAVPIIQRRPLIHPALQFEAMANPCLERDTLSSDGVDPFAYWYHWNPRLSGHDKNKTSFDCSLYYNEGTTIKTVKINFQENTPKTANFPDFAQFKDLDRPIRISVLMSANDNYRPVDFDQAEVSELVTKFLSDISVKEAQAQLPINNGSKYDKNLSKVLMFLGTLKNQIQIFDQKVLTNGPAMEVLLKTKLKLSKKDLEIKITLSHNGVKQGENFFAEHFAKDLLSRDIVVYEGHAGLGSTFAAPLELLKGQGQSFDKTVKYQILALHSCFASLYFNKEQFPAPSGPEFHRSFITTGGDFKDIMANGSIALISNLDTYLYNESYVPFGEWAKNFQSDNLYILSSD